MSSKAPKAYQHLAQILADSFDDGSDEAVKQRLAALPEPGSPWPTHPPPQFPMPWASHWGQGRFGLWCGFSVGDVVQRMRWIPPGEFWMGSLEEEPERLDREKRHRVVLTQGYWLADTACTQALWRAVMGDDPSRFKGDDLPVERVNWEQVQAFCTNLNDLVNSLQARLPSEAEWEYACRAGAETPFWCGEGLSAELANYNGNYPYNNGPKGAYREKTVSVKSFEPNPWGLYQVHGNVYEWCEDWYGEYAKEEVVDPQGPGRGSLRVLRGGSWVSHGRRLRAAHRFSNEPGARSYNLGFRLAAGPRPGGAEEPGGDEDMAARGSGSGRRRHGSGPAGRG